MKLSVAMGSIGIAASVAWSRPVAAEDALSLYQAMEIVTGTDMRERPRGFAQCLADVLVKVSGDARLRSDPRVAEAGRHAADDVVAFDYVDPIAGTRPKDDQGTYDRSENLTVTFDPAKIDALLVSLGDHPWRGARPTLIPVLTVHARHPPDYRLSADEPLADEQRAAFGRLASEAGVPIRFPFAAEFRTPGLVACASVRSIVVTGSLDWNAAAGGWVGTWRTCWKHTRRTWSIRGVGYDQAFQNIVEGVASLASGH